MTMYIEKMTNKICAEARKTAAAGHYFAPRQEATQIVNQIMADTKMACRVSILNEIDVPYAVKQPYLIAIDDAWVKEQK